VDLAIGAAAMSEYLHVKKPFMGQLAALEWMVIGMGYSFWQSGG